MTRQAFPWKLATIACLAALVAGAFLVYPLAVMQPFKRQDPAALMRALAVSRIAPAGSMVCAAVAVLATAIFWRRVRGWSRWLVCAVALLTCAAAVLARINVFERMFHPVGTPQFLAISEAKIDADDMVITVSFNGSSHAYPIREMGYHHVVNDVVGGVAVAATY